MESKSRNALCNRIRSLQTYWVFASTFIYNKMNFALSLTGIPRRVKYHISVNSLPSFMLQGSTSCIYRIDAGLIEGPACCKGWTDAARHPVIVLAMSQVVPGTASLSHGTYHSWHSAVTESQRLGSSCWSMLSLWTHASRIASSKKNVHWLKRFGYFKGTTLLQTTPFLVGFIGDINVLVRLICGLLPLAG